MTAVELQADKDRLRAEHAVEHNKLEGVVHKQRDTITHQAVELSDLAETLKVRDETIISLKTRIEELNARIGDLQEAFGSSEAALAATRLEMETVNVTLSARSAELEATSHLRAEAERQLTIARESLGDHDRQMQAIEARLGEAREKLRAEQAKARESRAEAQQTAQLLKTERDRMADLDAAHQRLISDKTDLEEKLARREAQMSRLRDARSGEEADLMELERRAADAEADRAEMENELGALTVRLVQIEKALDGKSVDVALAGRDAQVAQLQTDLKTERERAKALEERLEQAEARSDSAGDAGLRDEIAALAAEIVHMASVLEGDSSPIPDMVGEGGRGAGPDSLAARVRALQEMAKGQRRPEQPHVIEQNDDVKAPQASGLSS